MSGRLVLLVKAAVFLAALAVYGLGAMESPLIDRWRDAERQFGDSILNCRGKGGN